MTCQKHYCYFKMLRMLKPNCVLNLVPLPCLWENNLTNKLFLLEKAFNPDLKLQFSITGHKTKTKVIILASAKVFRYSSEQMDM